MISSTSRIRPALTATQIIPVRVTSAGGALSGEGFRGGRFGLEGAGLAGRRAPVLGPADERGAGSEVMGYPLNLPSVRSGGIFHRLLLTGARVLCRVDADVSRR